MSEEQSAANRELTGQIDFGFQVQAFLESEIGKYLIKRAEDEIADACEALKTVCPTDPVAITELQTRVYRAESIQFWLAEAMQTGVNAQIEFINRSQGD